MVQTPQDSPPALPIDEEESQVEVHEEAFARFGRKELSKRMEKFLQWRKLVLKNEDIEAVHQMRVASRRLRATLDAYQPIAQRKPLKKASGRVKEAADLLGAARGHRCHETARGRTALPGSPC